MCLLLAFDMIILQFCLNHSSQWGERLSSMCNCLTFTYYLNFSFQTDYIQSQHIMKSQECISFIQKYKCINNPSCVCLLLSKFGLSWPDCFNKFQNKILELRRWWPLGSNSLINYISNDFQTWNYHYWTFHLCSLVKLQ